MTDDGGFQPDNLGCVILFGRDGGVMAEGCRICEETDMLVRRGSDRGRIAEAEAMSFDVFETACSI
jgi:hypothetical protein